MVYIGIFLEEAAHLCCAARYIRYVIKMREKCEHEGTFCRCFGKYLTDGTFTLQCKFLCIKIREKDKDSMVVLKKRDSLPQTEDNL